MGRILFFLLLAVAIYLLWRSFQKRATGTRAEGAADGVPQAMVSCATCGLHLPRQEALPLGDRFFCCEEHRRHPPSA
jgi:uncharacterized protein